MATDTSTTSKEPSTSDRYADTKCLNNDRLIALANLLTSNVEYLFSRCEEEDDNKLEHVACDESHSNQNSFSSPSPSPSPSSPGTTTHNSVPHHIISPNVRVMHDYSDHANSSLDFPGETDDYSTSPVCNPPIRQLFPVKLHQLLSLPPEVVDPAIIGWAPHGRCFSVHKPGEFMRTLMKVFFNHNAITSFQRQLNLYGFKRITKAGSKDYGSYYHELFLRGRLKLCYRIRRQKIKGIGHKLLPNPENEPDFYSMTPCYENLNDAKQVEEKTAVPVATTEPSSAEVVHKGPLKTDDERSSSSLKLSKALKESLADLATSAVSPALISCTRQPSFGGTHLVNILGSQHLHDIATTRQYDSPGNHTSSLHGIGETVLGQPSLLLQPYLGTYRVTPLLQQQQSPHFVFPVGQRNFRPPSLDAVASILPFSQHDLQMQELIAHALLNRRDDVVAEVALRSELDFLNQAQRELLLQQHHLLNLIDQSQTEPSASYLLQVAKAYRQLM